MPNSSQILLYFPNFSPKVFPNKQYMINIVNTLDPGLIIETLKQIKKKREKREIEECPVIMTGFFK